MNLRRALFETANAALRPLGLHIDRTDADYRTSIPQDHLFDLIVDALVNEWGRWYDSMTTAEPIHARPIKTRDEFVRGVADFLQEYRVFTGKNSHSGGLFLNNTISLFAVASFFDAPTVVDSGTYTGNSAWALSRACPDSAIHSFDITHVALRHREPRVTYHLGDWAGIVCEPFANQPALGFFDDHVDQVRRLEECAARNVKYLVFDDDTPVNATHNGHNERSFPKISFMFSNALLHVPMLEWRRLGREYRVPIDHHRLRAAKSRIAHYSRLPDLFPITGFTHQWPLSLVILKDGSDAGSMTPSIAP